jgi:hypothetical protein
MKELREREAEVLRLKKVLQGILRHAAGFCDMTILDDKEDKVFREVFQNGSVNSFVHKIKQEVLEEQKEKRRRRRRKSAKKRKNKAARITVEETVTHAQPPAEGAEPGAAGPTTEQQCVICNNHSGDVPCQSDDCNNMICWFCWGELTDDSKLCPSCAGKET